MNIHLMDMALPDKTLAVMEKLDNMHFAPTGETTLKENDGSKSPLRLIFIA